MKVDEKNFLVPETVELVLSLMDVCCRLQKYSHSYNYQPMSLYSSLVTLICASETIILQPISVTGQDFDDYF